MKILVIENFWLGGKKLRFYEKLLLNTFSILPSLYARQLAAITPKKHSVKIVNERYSSIDFNEDYDIVLINFNFSSVTRAFDIADIFKQKNIPVVLSGWYPSIFPNDAKNHSDSILIGKNETCWLELLNDFENDKLRPFYGPKKFDKSVNIPPTNVKIPGFLMTGAIEATRGCPYMCEFCPETNIPGGSQYFTRPIDDVVDEIKSIPQKTIMFYDNSLTVNPTYTKSLFKKMKGLRKKFFCNGNVDVLAHDTDLVRLSKEAGCIAWLVGFESIDQNTIDSVGKSTNKVVEYEQAIRNIHDNHMVVIGEFIFGFDTDTKEVFEKTLTMIKTLEIDIADFSILTPFPNTPLFKKLDSVGRILTKDWSIYDLGHVVFMPNHMTPEELQIGIRWMYDAFYQLPCIIKRLVRSLRWGVYPFFVIFTRNLVSMIGRKRLLK
ncbi:MAG TPA: radical SAM protein [Candidatus Thermoplasmatota archaeon]|nr:radical SAM protein [Candidatus Thermoplasmatota archaeon]